MALGAKATIQQGKRTFNRLRIGLPASLILPHERSACMLENISSTGACVRVERSIAKGSTVIFCFHLLRAYAVAIWSRDTLCGLQFERPLEMEDMQGFLWIVENRKEYERICREELLRDLGTGFGR